MLPQDNSASRIRGRLRGATAITSDLMCDVIANACVRIHAMRGAKEAIKLRRLIAAEAWMEAALVLLQLELPHWKLRRLACDSGEWCCSLSKEPRLPEWLDDTVEVIHPDLSLAIINATFDARAQSQPSRVGNGSVPECRPQSTSWEHTLGCDNFR
jgi:hypothetical protein